MNPDNNGEISNEYYKKLNQQIVQKDNLIKLLQLQIRNLKTQIESEGSSGAKDLEELKKELQEKASESEKLQSELENQKKLFVNLETEKDKEIESLNQILSEKDDSENEEQKALIEEQNQKITALTQEIEKLNEELTSLKGSTGELDSLKEDIEAKEAQLEEKQSEIENLTKTIEETSKAKEETENKVSELETTISNLESNIENLENQGLASDSSSEELTQALDNLETLTSEFTALQEKFEELEKEQANLINENEELQVELAAFKTLDAEDQQFNAQRNEIEDYILEIEKLREASSEKDEAIAKLQVELDKMSGNSLTGFSPEDEMQLTNQIADQLLAIQGFETKLKTTQEELNKKEEQIAMLKAQLDDGKTEQKQEPIPIDGESTIISSFIDFFDGLDSIISKNPIPELQLLHQKLLDQLITPNQISYMQVISETFQPEKHLATDYFRSDEFPERCMVFEVEKGYTKGDLVVKKPKVWVVQNLYNCPNCGTMQSSADSKFCHLCGHQILAPNGLAIDSLPIFEPTAITYSKFAERMLEKGNEAMAKEYIQKGLGIDSNYLPLILKNADILANDSNFNEALEMLNKANSLKQDPKTEEKITAIETKLNIYNQAKNLKLSEEEIDKLLKLIQK